MYIAQLKIENFRCFKDATIEFQPGVNVIIGENNGGKSALLAALGCIFERQGRRRPSIHDIHKGISDFTAPPIITITATIRSSYRDTAADKALVSTWLTKLTPSWEATLTYRSFLPEDEIDTFLEKLGDAPSKEHFFDVVAAFLPKYSTRIYGGNPEDQNVADPENVSRFDFQFLDALRDAKSELFSGANPLLKSMLQEVLDRSGEPGEQQGKFREISKELLENIKGRLDKDSLFQFVNETGAADGGVLSLQGAVDENDFINALQLFVSQFGTEVPMSHNGLGYNNLVYISLVLAQMDIKSDVKKQGRENAVLFPLLVLEEPEAHLHPSLQHKLLRFMRQRITNSEKSRQAFITTHSTHITSACCLDEIICMTAATESSGVGIAYPGKVFADTNDGRSSKKYVERFLDATKSNMLFAKGILFVEGIAEQLVLPQLAEIICYPLDNNHIAIVRVDGSTFKHFLPLFGACPAELRSYALIRPVACIPDADPARKEKDVKGAKRKGCWPYQIDRDTGKYEYYPHSGVIDNLEKLVGDADNIKICHGTMTFEYDLAMENHRNSYLVSPDQTHLLAYCNAPDGDHPELLELVKPEVMSDLEASQMVNKQSEARFATYYLLSVGDNKGEHAFNLAGQLQDNIDVLRVEGFVVPQHLQDAILWVCGNVGEGR